MPTVFNSVALSSACVFLLGFVTSPIVNATDAVWNTLEEGGRVVIMRHAPVEKGAGSGDPLLRDPSCKKERGLSDEGKRAAEVIGSRFKEHNVPVSMVLHSPFCRTAATAKLAFGEAYPAEYLSLLEILTPEKASQQTKRLSQAIGSYQGDGVLILITHEPNITAISFELLGHLDFLVLDPRGGDEFEELGVIRFAD